MASSAADRFGGVAMIGVLAAGVFMFYYGEPRRWNEAQQADTPEVYSAYLRDYPDGTWREEAQARLTELETQAWSLARLADTHGGYERFTLAFPDGKYRAAAESLRQGLAWRELQSRSASAFEYDRFLRLYPTSPHAAEARRRAHDDVWRALSADGTTLEDLEGFLERYPDSPRAEQALQRIHGLLWQSLQARRAGAEDYRAFIERFPDSPHRVVAEGLASGRMTREGPATSTHATARRVEGVRDTQPEATSQYERIFGPPPPRSGRSPRP